MSWSNLDASREVEQLRATLAAEQEIGLRTLHRAERAEAERDRLKDEFHGLMNSRGDWQARAEQAERERDEARNGWLRDAELLKRAEADNAALEEIASEDHRSPVDGNGAGYGRAFAEGWKARGLHIRRIVGALKSQPAPAVPAEYVRALERVRNEVVSVQGQDRLGEDETTETIMSFVRAADALKGKP